jgi:two-component system cell cycle sensor histidine kinase PleC
MDTGIGIAIKNIKRIFEPFAQIEPADSKAHQGTGLGLSIVKALIELHNGRIEIESEPGSGTTASLYFPDHRTP